LRVGCLSLVLQGLVFSENKMGRGGQVVEDPIQKSVVWLADLRKILTLDNLQKGHIILVDRCFMCKRNTESIGHLILHCEVLVPFGMFSSIDLGYVGLCLNE
jgi:hypothetical protein